MFEQTKVKLSVTSVTINRFKLINWINESSVLLIHHDSVFLSDGGIPGRWH
jgi:hypothetical protein